MMYITIILLFIHLHIRDKGGEGERVVWHKGKKTNILALIIIIIKGTDGAQMGHI